MDDDKILLKELDHVQAIIGRYDSFFFLMKQVCLVLMATLFSAAIIKQNGTVAGLIFIVPMIFLILEITFRYLYWTRYLRRMETIRLTIQGGPPLAVRYQLKEDHRGFRKRAWWLWRSVKKFDVFYYGNWAVAAFAAGGFLCNWSCFPCYLVAPVITR